MDAVAVDGDADDDVGDDERAGANGVHASCPVSLHASSSALLIVPPQRSYGQACCWAATEAVVRGAHDADDDDASTCHAPVQSKWHRVRT